MPSLRVLAKILLIILLLTDGVLGAAAATYMATHHAPSDGDSVGHVTHDSDPEPASGCKKSVKVSSPGGEHDPAPEDCSCSEDNGCNCNYSLSLQPRTMVLLFWLQRSSSVHPATVSLNPPRLPMSPVFRPPIG